ncbi:MAG TPA: hypothetical protein VK539_27640 [Myxococcaceae bacterium]|nr:hypothetical protein [Myxococcaceae bacterium]
MMTRSLRHVALLGAVMLGTGCEQSVAPAESNVVPRPVFLAADKVQLTSRVSGVAYDPEAFFFNLAMCGPTCQIPPFLSEGVPHYLRSAVRGANVMPLDVAAQPQPQPIGPPAVADNLGMWLLPAVPARYEVPYFMLATGAGALPDPTEPLGPPLPQPPRTDYLPTLTLRPVMTGGSGTCVSQEAAHIGKNGVLEAVSRHLTATGTPTTVEDLVNPTKYWGTNVLWFYAAGNPVLRAPADNVSLEVNISGGLQQTYVIDWAPPGVLPPFLNQSSRGFYVTNAATSSLGLYVVLLPVAGPPPSSIQYLVKDTKTSTSAQRPWEFPPIQGGIGPGSVTFVGVQMFYKSNPLRPSYPPPPQLCLPPGL